MLVHHTIYRDDLIGFGRVYDHHARGAWDQVGSEIEGFFDFHYFDDSVAISDRFLVTGVPKSGGIDATGAFFDGIGCVYAYERIDNDWILDEYFPGPLDDFAFLGTQVEISTDGDVLAYTAPGVLNSIRA
jgi:hypothetical protein